MTSVGNVNTTNTQQLQVRQQTTPSANTPNDLKKVSIFSKFDDNKDSALRYSDNTTKSFIDAGRTVQDKSSSLSANVFKLVNGQLEQLWDSAVSKLNQSYTSVEVDETQQASEQSRIDSETQAVLQTELDSINANVSAAYEELVKNAQEQVGEGDDSQTVEVFSKFDDGNQDGKMTYTQDSATREFFDISSLEQKLINKDDISGLHQMFNNFSSSVDVSYNTQQVTKSEQSAVQSQIDEQTESTLSNIAGRVENYLDTKYVAEKNNQYQAQINGGIEQTNDLAFEQMPSPGVPTNPEVPFSISSRPQTQAGDSVTIHNGLCFNHGDTSVTLNTNGSTHSVQYKNGDMSIKVQGGDIRLPGGGKTQGAQVSLAYKFK